MKGLVITLLLFSAGQALAQPAEWAFDMTTENHTIIIQALVNPKVNGASLPQGSWIGVFYDAGGALKCAGKQQWAGRSTTVAAFGKDEETAGFKKGETFKYKLAIPIEGGKSFCIVEDVEVSYQAVDGQLISDTKAYVKDGVSSISAMNGSADCFGK